LGPKIDSYGLVIWASKSPQWFLDLGLKTKAGNDLLVAPQNRQEDEDSAGQTLRSSGLLHVEASQARVSQSGLKTDGGAAEMVHVTSSWRSRADEDEDGQVDAICCIRPFYCNFAIFYVLGPRGILVF
jgi:hypothetical protein